MKTPSTLATLLKAKSLSWDVMCLIPLDERNILSLLSSDSLISFLLKNSTLTKDDHCKIYEPFIRNLISVKLETMACWYLLKIRKLEFPLGPPKSQLILNWINNLYIPLSSQLFAANPRFTFASLQHWSPSAVRPQRARTSDGGAWRWWGQASVGKSVFFRLDPSGWSQVGLKTSLLVSGLKTSLLVSFHLSSFRSFDNLLHMKLKNYMDINTIDIGLNKS